MKLDTIPYASPIVRYDPVARILVIEDRNPGTGNVIGQTPSVATVRQADVAALSGGPPPNAAAEAAPAAAEATTGAASGSAVPAAPAAGVSLVV